ncbi:MAG: glycosyltransferase family 4 protein [Acidobacteria bacterium]|nr:glycosyltransferase family 4 protein [Acidobacteriota bacterium]
MARLAWFTPLPPERSGIADYNAALLPRLAAAHDIDVFTGTEAPQPLDITALPVFPAHEYGWRQLQRPYDLNVYQLGNAPCHDFIWPHLAHYPGLVVLHDGQLHHARARLLLAAPEGATAAVVRRGRDAYRSEFLYNHPEAPPDVSRLVIDSLAGSIYYLYPMLRWVVRTARLVAVHNPGFARDISAEYPSVVVRTIRSGMTDPLDGNAPICGRQLRDRYGVPRDAVLFAAYGLVTPEKRIPAILRAFAAIPASAHLLLAGGRVAHYDPAAEAETLGVAHRVHLTGYVPDEELDAHVAMCDVCLSLRWPSGRETSATWLRALAAGKPTVVTDLAHGGEVRMLEPRTWRVLPAPLARPGSPTEPVSVAVSLTDEQVELEQAMRRLNDDPTLREALGRAGRAHWAVHQTMDAATDDYRAAIAHALACPAPRVHDLPAHLRPDPMEAARRIASEWGVRVDILEG